MHEAGSLKPVLYVTSVGSISFHFKSETSPGRRAFNRGETERVYTAARTRARVFPRVAALFLRVATRWPTRRLCHFLLNPHPLLRMPRTLGVPMSSATSRQTELCAQKS